MFLFFNLEYLHLVVTLFDHQFLPQMQNKQRRIVTNFDQLLRLSKKRERSLINSRERLPPN